jgi:small subunit ribosomal protein S16
MAVRLRLTRQGSKKNPHYLVVAVDQAKKRDGAYLDRLGRYQPKAKEISDKVQFDFEAVKKWTERGAVPSQTVAQLLKLAGWKKS